MDEYKLDTNWSASTLPKEFSSEKEAWNTLRKIIPGKYAILYKKVVVPDLRIVNRTNYIKRYNAKYTTQKIGDTNPTYYWIPVLQGSTNDSYRGIY